MIYNFLKPSQIHEKEDKTTTYLLGLFDWGACRVSKLQVMSKRKSYKIDRIVREMHAMSSLGLYARVPTAHSLRGNPLKLWRTEWAVGTHACIHLQKKSAKLDKE